MTKENIIKEFVRQFYIEKTSLHDSCFKNGEQRPTLTNVLYQKMNLTPEQQPIFKEFTDVLLTDAFYSILLGLDGASSIGEHQQSYTIIDEDNNNLSDGNIEAYAYEFFHNDLFNKENRK